MEEVAREADILIIAVSGAAEPIYIKRDWIKPGQLLLLPAEVRFDDDLHTDPSIRKVVEAFSLMDGFIEDMGEDIYDWSMTGLQWHKLIKEGKLAADQIEEIADIATGKLPGRKSEDEIILFSSTGMPAEDVAWGTEVYNNAVAKGIGVKLNLWEEPTLF